MDSTQASVNDGLWPETLRRRFRALIFDWDGTAVPDRYSRAESLVAALEAVLRQGIQCAIITGTSIDTVQNQCTRYLSAEAKRHLIACTSRGSEVYLFGEKGEERLVHRYTAPPEREERLDRATEATRKMFLELGMPVEVISNRLNRRKVDLIPLDRWKEPEKGSLAELLGIVQERLKGIGFKRGLAEALERTLAICEECELREVSVTSDIKHIEIGLTDKSDSVAWVKSNVLDPDGIAPEDTAVIGNEFGTIGGMPGSDSMMSIPGLENAVFVSVGMEPEGAPPQITHLGGGHQRFIDFLYHQVATAPTPAAAPEEVPRPAARAAAEDQWNRTADVNWIIRQQGFSPSAERERETIFAIGNGYVGVRGSCNLLIPGSQADLFLAGVYDAKASSLPYSEVEFMTGEDRDEPFSELVSFPFPFQLRVSVGGRELGPGSPFLQDYERELDIKRSVLYETYTFRDDVGRETRLRTLRCASLRDPHLLLHEIDLQTVNHSDPLEIDTSLEDPDVRLRHPHLVFIQHGNDEQLSDLHVFETRQSKVRICFAARTCLNGQEVTDTRISLRPERGQSVRIGRFISIYTDRDVPDAVASARAHVLSKKWPEIASYLGEHAKDWEDFWDSSDIEIVGNPAVTETLRFNSYHLRIAAPDDPRASMGARTLSGRAYEGHIFWDVEIFILPFFIYSRPEVARNLLRYRHSTLNGARERARALGYEGACYAWESTASGRDATPKTISLKGTDATVPIFTGTQQIHVTGGVAFAAIRYWDATGDADFIRNYGAEILFETARFWVSRASERDGSFHILGVVGPDEYHHGVNDNAYTNWMARYNLQGAIRVAEWLQASDRRTWESLSERLVLRSEEVRSWKDMYEGLHLPQPGPDGVIPQFEGFFDLKDVPLSSEEQYRAPFERLLKWKDVNASKLIKQADLLMIPFLFPNAYSQEIIRANFRYYEKITDHGSSLSPSVHAAIASRIGEHETAAKYWKSSLNLDLMNLMKNTALGFHAACAGGTWQSLIFHILGIEIDAEGNLQESIRPAALPVAGEAARLKLKSRGRTISYSIPSVRNAG